MARASLEPSSCIAIAHPLGLGTVPRVNTKEEKMESESLVPFPFPKVSKLGNPMTVSAKINIH